MTINELEKLLKHAKTISPLGGNAKVEFWRLSDENNHYSISNNEIEEFSEGNLNADGDVVIEVCSYPIRSVWQLPLN